MELWERTTWLNPNIDFLFGVELYEYDMESAGPSLCKEFSLLDEKTLIELDKMDKYAKNVRVGIIQKNDKEFAKKLSEAFKEARKRFLTANELTEDKIVSIKKDAIFIYDKKIKECDFGEIHFRKKNKYSSYLKLNKLEFYLNTMTKTADIKGLGQGDELTGVNELHGKYMLKFIMSFSRMRETNIQPELMKNFLVEFVRRYRNKELDIEYYRELARGNAFKVFDDELGEDVVMEYTDDIENVSIIHNYVNYIIPLVNLYI